MDFLRPWFPSLAVFAASVLGGLLLRSLVLRRLQAWAKNSETLIDDVLVESLVRPMPVWIMLAGLAAAIQASPLSPAHILLGHKGVVAVFLLSVTFAAANLASLAVSEYTKSLRGSAQTTGVVDNLVRGVVLVLGGLLILSNLGISITPLLGALGVGSLAVALALQDTLTNLFAGLHIVASRIVSPGDFVRLDSGQEGTVTDVGWRVTRILEGGGNDIILPNSKLANAALVNFHRPTADCSVAIPMSAASGSDLNKVERVTVEVAREIQRSVSGATRGYEPMVRFNAFAPGEVRFNVILHSDTYADRFLMTHEFIKAVHARYGSEGIELPKQAQHLKQE